MNVRKKKNLLVRLTMSAMHRQWKLLSLVSMPLKKAGLDEIDGAILDLVKSYSGQPVGKIYAALALPDATSSRRLIRLHKVKFVRVQLNPHDGRQRIARMAPRGAEALEHWHAAVREVYGNIPIRYWGQLESSLKQLNGALWKVLKSKSKGQWASEDWKEEGKKRSLWQRS